MREWVEAVQGRKGLEEIDEGKGTAKGKTEGVKEVK